MHSQFFFAGRALLYQSEINTFVSINKDLRDLELSDTEWQAIHLVETWLREFRDATTEMSITSQPMLSHVHAVFRGLQEHIRKALAQLPDSADQKIKAGLLSAHAKLSVYYNHFDQSPYYLWAARELTMSCSVS